MYFVDFFKNVFKKKNIGIIIWLMLNTVLMCFILGSCIKEELPYDLLFSPALRYTISYASGIVIYFITVLIALSPVGEFFLRLQNGCKKIVRHDHIERLLPLFEEVYKKAKAECPELSENIQMFMSDDDEPNAFAVGRNTICVTKGLLNYSDDEISAVLSHEFGHIAHKDTDAILIVTVGNMIVSLLFILFRLFVNVVARILNFMFSVVSDSLGTFVAGTLTRLLIDFLLVLVMNLWTKLGVLLCLHSSRQAEFSADEFANSLGYGDELCEFLDKTDDEEYNSKGLWAILNSTHPDTDDRIAELQKLGCLSTKEKDDNNSKTFSKKIKVKIANSNDCDLYRDEVIDEKSYDKRTRNDKDLYLCVENGELVYKSRENNAKSTTSDDTDISNEMDFDDGLEELPITNSSYAKKIFKIFFIVFLVLLLVGIGLYRIYYHNVERCFEDAWKSTKISLVMDVYNRLVLDVDDKSKQKKNAEKFDSCLNEKLEIAIEDINDGSLNGYYYNGNSRTGDYIIRYNYCDFFFNQNDYNNNKIITSYTVENQRLWQDIQELLESKDSYNLGIKYYENNELEAAEECFEKVIESDKLYDEAQEYISKCYIKLNY